MINKLGLEQQKIASLFIQFAKEIGYTDSEYCIKPNNNVSLTKFGDIDKISVFFSCSNYRAKITEITNRKRSLLSKYGLCSSIFETDIDEIVIFKKQESLKKETQPITPEDRRRIWNSFRVIVEEFGVTSYNRILTKYKKFFQHYGEDGDWFKVILIGGNSNPGVMEDKSKILNRLNSMGVETMEPRKGEQIFSFNARQLSEYKKQNKK